MFKDHQKFQQLIDLGMEIAQVHDTDVLLGKILSAARKLVNADAGTIYIKRGNNLRFSHVQNDTLQKQLASGRKLVYSIFSLPIGHHSISGYVATTGETINIPDAYKLNTDQIPYAFDHSYDEKMKYHTQSILTVPLKNNQSQIIGVMQLINAKDENEKIIPFSEIDIPIVQTFANNATMAIERTHKTSAEILGLVRVLTELRDPEETEAHVNRVGAYSAEIYETWARKKGIEQAKIETDAEILRMAAMLHDLGKLAVPQSIREKSGKYTAEEYKIMQQHTVKGAQMLLKSAQTEYEKVAAQIALNHHEYWNGTGYPGHVNPLNGRALPGYEDKQGKPRGKIGEEIPIFGRIVAIADVYDSLLCHRAFRTAVKEIDVLKTLKSEAGERFDPEMVEAFFSCLDSIHAIAHSFPEEHEI
jgi:putative nucleotidyltransferase with HDIG domain